MKALCRLTVTLGMAAAVAAFGAEQAPREIPGATSPGTINRLIRGEIPGLDVRNTLTQREPAIKPAPRSDQTALRILSVFTQPTMQPSQTRALINTRSQRPMAPKAAPLPTRSQLSTQEGWINAPADPLRRTSPALDMLLRPSRRHLRGQQRPD